MILELTAFLLALASDKQLSTSRRRTLEHLQQELGTLPPGLQRRQTVEISKELKQEVEVIYHHLREFLLWHLVHDIDPDDYYDLSATTEGAVFFDEYDGKPFIDSDEFDVRFRQLLVETDIDEELLEVTVKREFLGRGSYRAVFRLMPGLVVKVAILNGDEEMNLLEYDRYKAMPPHIRKHVVPIVHLGEGGSTIIAEEAEPIRTMHQLNDEQRRKYGAVKSLMTRYDLRYDLNMDLDHHNWGFHNGHIKLMDLANEPLI